MKNLESIIFFAISSNDSKKEVWALTAKEAIKLFLESFKSSKFYVNEYRNGQHLSVVGGEGSYFRKKFNSRKEAIDFLKQ